MNFGFLAFLFCAIVTPCFGQLPPSQRLSPADQKEFTQELARLLRVLETANDKCSVEAEIARTYAAGGQYREAIDWLQKVVDRNVGLDLSRDRLFVPLADSAEFKHLASVARAQTFPIRNSHLFAILPKTNLFPESIAYDRERKDFLLGSTSRDEIVRCSQKGKCESFVSALQPDQGYALGIKIDQQSKMLWATRNTSGGASLRAYNLVSHQLIREFSLPGPHLFNDLAVSSHSDVFVTDTRAGAIYKVAPGDERLRQVAAQHLFNSANGITLSKGERKLFVASFGEGISIVDLASEAITAMLHPANVCLGYIDGLYRLEDRLIAIQNGPMSPRIVSFSLSREGDRIMAMKILERRNADFDGLTTGVVLNHRFLYVANSQIDKKDLANAKLAPLKVLALNLLP